MLSNLVTFYSMKEDKEFRNMDNIKIGKLIAKRRKQKGLTQSQLAEYLGVSNKTVSKWENEVSQTKGY